MMLDQTPVFVSGNAIGCLLIHGFTGGPWDLRPLADALVGQGYTVSLPLLPGHGNNNEQLGSVRWRDWERAADEAYAVLRQRCTTTVLVGFSMGGALALRAMVRQPADLLVLLAPALGLTSDWRMRVLLRSLPVTRFVRPYFYPLAQANFADPSVRARVAKFAPADINLDDPQVQTEIRQRVRIAMRAVDNFYRLALRAGRLGPTIKQPTLIEHGRHDGTIPLHFSQALYRRLGSEDKQLRVWEKGEHMLVTGAEGSAVTAEIVAWIAAHISEKP